MEKLYLKSSSNFTYLTFVVYKTCLSQSDSHMHEAQVRGNLLGAYLHCTATTPFETVCKQFINGSDPFSYSLNSGFDAGNDSWFSSGAWQVGTPVQKMPAGTGALWVGERRVPRGLGYHFLFGLALRGGEKKNSFVLFNKKLRRKAKTFTGSVATVFFLQVCPLTCTRSAWEGGTDRFHPGDAKTQLPSKVITLMAFNKLPAS